MLLLIVIVIWMSLIVIVSVFMLVGMRSGRFVCIGVSVRVTVALVFLVPLLFRLLAFVAFALVDSFAFAAPFCLPHCVGFLFALFA